MKQSKRIALCGMISALSVVIMLASYFPYLTFALPVIAGTLFMVIVVEINAKWAIGCYFTAAIISVLLCEKEAAVLFVAFFGYYAIAKAFLERIPFRCLEYIIKFFMFNICIVAAYAIIVFILGIPLEGLTVFGKYTLLILLALANLMFWLYDLALAVVYSEYMDKIHPKIAKLLK